jgi:hypothetical protein
MMWQTIILLTSLHLPANLDEGIALCKQREYEQGYATLCRIHEYNVPGHRQAEYWFYKGLAAHQLGMRKEAEDNLNDLLTGFYETPPPRRYIAVALAMLNDMQTWKPSGLDNMSRKMKSISRRLDVDKGRSESYIKETKRQQKEVLAKLDEMIKEAENKAKNKNKEPKGCPSQGPPKQSEAGDPSGQRSQQAASDSKLPTGQATGVIDMKKVRETAKVWGKLPEHERAKAMVELTRGMPPRYRDAIESYFRTLQSKSTVK